MRAADCFDWSPDRVAKLAEMWAEGISAAAIGKELGCGKNAVIGKRRRLKLPDRGNPSTRGPESYYKQKPAPSFTQPEIKRPAGHSAVRDTFDALGLTLYRTRVPASARLPIPVGAVGPARTCQWTDSVRSPWAWCGVPSLAGYSWCPAHKARAFKRVGEDA